MKKLKRLIMLIIAIAMIYLALEYTDIENLINEKSFLNPINKVAEIAENINKTAP